MPRYFFHTQVGGDVITDTAGVELPDADAAWEAARDTIRSTMADPKDQTRLLAASLVVTDAAGEVVLEFPFSEAVTLPSSRDPTMH
jgi:hypothetical protein